MITAKEAKELYDQSGAEVEEWLKYHVDEQVKFAAKSGLRTIFVDCGNIESYSSPKQPSPLEKGVIKKLTDLGYRVTWIPKHGESYVPRGLADDAGEGPKYFNFGIQVIW